MPPVLAQQIRAERMDSADLHQFDVGLREFLLNAIFY
jgi:hypothetical protein